MKLSIILRKIKRNINDYGTWNTFKKGIEYILQPIYEKRIYRIYGINLEEIKDFEINQDNKYIFKIINEDDVKEICQIEKMEEWLEDKIEKKIKYGSMCLCILDGNRVAGFNLVSFGKVYIPLIKKEKVWKEEEAWSEQITINKAYRNKGLGSILRYKVFVELKKRGIKRLYGGTLINNIANLKLTRKVGFNEIVDVHFLKLIIFKKYKYKIINQNEPRITNPFI